MKLEDARRKVQLVGDPHLLVALAKRFGTGTPCVVHDGAEYLMYAEDFEPLSAQNDVKKLAQRYANTMTALAKLSENSDQNVTAETVYEKQLDGKFVGYVIAGPMTMSGRGRMEILGPPDPRDQDLLDLASTNQSVEKALRIFNNDQSYAGLFKVFEIIRDDLGGKEALQASGWMSGKQIKRFGGTANHPDLSGDLARHGTPQSGPVDKPMPLSEAPSWAHS